LDKDVTVREANNQTILGWLVLVLVLRDELVALTVVSAALFKLYSSNNVRNF
jgi:hypothetical protein